MTMASLLLLHRRSLAERELSNKEVHTQAHDAKEKATRTMPELASGRARKAKAQAARRATRAHRKDIMPKERQHFADVCYSLVAYGANANGDLRYLQDHYAEVTDPFDRVLMLEPDPQKMWKEMRACHAVNARFLALLVESDESAQRYVKLPHGHHVEERNASKAHTVLRQFVRDWTMEGKPERDNQYGLLLKALEKYVPLAGCTPSKGSQSARPRVLVPGCGLSRLPFEAAGLGYSAEGNEFSYHMLQGSKWVLNETHSARTHTIYPFLLSMENRKTARAQLRPVKIPDICPSEVLSPGGVSGPQVFSMSAGEFVENYKNDKAAWDSVLTCFFLDTAKNVFFYIRTIADIIRPGGLWANIGPLLFHYAEQPTAISIELSWEEIKPAISKYFDFQEEEERPAYYTTNEQGLFHTRYRCVFFAVLRNGTPTEGVSHPVF